MVVAIGLQAADPAERPQQVTRVVRADPRTGKLVRSVMVAAKPNTVNRTAPAKPRNAVTAPAPNAAPALPHDEIHQVVDIIAASQQLPPQLVHSVIKVESNYNPNALSNKGAQGLMQLMPDTARRFGVENAFDPIDNIQGGTRYLKYLLDLYKGDYRLALAAYNAGEGAIEKYGTVPPYAETQNYLVLVNQQLRKNLEVATVKPEPLPEKPKVEEAKPEGPSPIEQVVLPDGRIRYVSR